MSRKEALTEAADLPALDDLKTRFSGSILRPDDEGYRGLALAPGGEPAFNARATTPEDVVQAIRYAHAEGLPLSVRSGGHTAGSWTTTAGGFVLDLSGINSIEVLDDNLVRLGSGATWGAVAKALEPHRLALTSGDTTSVGIGGLTLGGGIGWMVRKYGLALDNLVAADVVTADGTTLTASASENADLFWAIRGGGGNFGVVTHFTFRAHPLAGVHAGAISFDADDLAPLLRGWRDAMRSAPEELNATFLAMPSFGPEMPANTQIHVCYAGDDDEAASAAIEPLLRIPGASGHDVTAKAYAEVLDDPHPPGGAMTVVGNNGFLPDFSDESIDAIAQLHRDLGGAVLMIRSLGGALNRVPADATAFGFRDSEALVISAAFLPPDAPASATQRVHDLWAALSEYLEGSYGNFMTDSSDDAVASIYPPSTLARLAEIKHRYDPGNLFNQNQNIRPAEHVTS